MKYLLLAAALLCLLSPAEARQHRHHHHHHHHRASAAVQLGCDLFCMFGGSRFAASNPPLGRPSRFIAGRLSCARNVGVALAERGIKGTGSALALSYLHWGRSAGGPVPGAVIVSSRRGGGHVALVSRVVNGVVFAWNASGGQRGWREIQYRHRVIDYRVPG
jgi:hypothetical protein